MLNEQFNVSLARTLEAGIYLTYFRQICLFHASMETRNGCGNFILATFEVRVYILSKWQKISVNLSYLIPEDGSIICCGKKILDTS